MNPAEIMNIAKEYRKYADSVRKTIPVFFL